MKRFKPPQPKKITLTPKEIADLKKTVTKDAVKKAMLIFLESAKDELKLEYEQCRAIYLRADRYSNYLDDHLVSMKQMAEDLYKDTGIDIRWR